VQEASVALVQITKQEPEERKMMVQCNLRTPLCTFSLRSAKTKESYDSEPSNEYDALIK
jgi:hypothetical protein